MAQTHPVPGATQACEPKPLTNLGSPSPGWQAPARRPHPSNEQGLAPESPVSSLPEGPAVRPVQPCSCPVTHLPGLPTLPSVTGQGLPVPG